MTSPKPNLITSGNSSIIAMTDLFVSAAAALLVVLAISQPNPPIPLPVQANYLLLCPTFENPQIFYISASSSAQRDDQAQVILTQADLFEFDDLEGLMSYFSISPPVNPLFTVLGLVSAKNYAITAACVQSLNQKFVAKINRNPDPSTYNNDEYRGIPTLRLSSATIEIVG